MSAWGRPQATTERGHLQRVAQRLRILLTFQQLLLESVDRVLERPQRVGMFGC